MYSITLGPRCFKWNMLSLSGPKALLFLQLLIAFIIRSAVNVFPVTTRVSLEEVCMPNFEVWWLAAWTMRTRFILWLTFCSAINSFNSSPQLGQFCLLVDGFNKVSQFLPFVYTDTVLDVFIQSWTFR